MMDVKGKQKTALSNQPSARLIMYNDYIGGHIFVSPRMFLKKYKIISKFLSPKRFFGSYSI